MRLQVKGYGKYLGTEKLNFTVKEKAVEAMPFHSVTEIKLPSGNYVSTKALAWASIYGINACMSS